MSAGSAAHARSAIRRFLKVEVAPARDAFRGTRPGARPPDQAFEQRRAGKAVGAVQSRARNFADSAQAVHCGPAKIVRGDAAATVMGCGDNGDGFAREVDPALQADRIDAGNAREAGRQACA